MIRRLKLQAMNRLVVGGVPERDIEKLVNQLVDHAVIEFEMADRILNKEEIDRLKEHLENLQEVYEPGAAFIFCNSSLYFWRLATHSLARRCASAIWAGVILFSTIFQFFAAFLSPCDAETFHHIWALE